MTQTPELITRLRAIKAAKQDMTEAQVMLLAIWDMLESNDVESRAIREWNDASDEYNQWHELGADEQINAVLVHVRNSAAEILGG